MEEKGLFDSNPANPNARDSDGNSIYQKVEYPKMLYHPKGETRVSTPGTWETTPFGPKLLGEQRELVWIAVKNQKEEETMLAEGWHRHPADAIEASFTPEQRAAGAKAPPKSAQGRIADLEAEITRLQKEKRESQASTDNEAA